MSSKIGLKTARINEIIGKYLPEEKGHQQILFEAMNYSINAGGKRIRPMLMQETYKLLGGDTAVIEPFMAAMEMIHTSSLIHDDLPCMDNDRLRRGKETAWVKYGYDMAVLAGDGLMVYAFETASKGFSMTDNSEEMSRVGECIRILAEKSGIYGMIGGQTVDVQMTGKPLSAEQLDFIYSLKTGALIEASMLIGAVLAGADEREKEIVEKIAAGIGMAFQIQDDILDVVSSQKELGKPVLSDEKNQKTTYVTLEGLEKSEQEVRDRSEETIRLLKTLPGDSSFLEELVELLIIRKR